MITLEWFDRFVAAEKILFDEHMAELHDLIAKREKEIRKDTAESMAKIADEYSSNHAFTKEAVELAEAIAADIRDMDWD